MDLREDKYYQIILILIYTGLRIDELLSLEKENVHLNERYLDIVKSKTKSGIRKCLLVIISTLLSKIGMIHRNVSFFYIPKTETI